MNWKLILQLSLFGLAMAFATVFWIPSKIEPAFWLVIFVVCAYIIAKKCRERYFLHGFMVSILNSLWITGVHAGLSATYMASHPDEAEMMASMPMPDSPRLMMVMIGPLFGVAFGLILGVFALIASRFVKKGELV